MGYFDGLDLNGTDAWDGDGGIDDVADGDYVLRVNNCAVEKSNAGKPTLVTDIEVVSAADGSETNEAGKTLKDWRSLTKNKTCMKRVKALIVACGVELDDNGGFDTDDFEGTEFVATVRHEAYTKTMSDGKKKTFDNPRISRERPVE